MQVFLVIDELRHLQLQHDCQDAQGKADSDGAEDDARQTLGDLVFKIVIPRNVRVSEAPSFALPVISYDPSSRGSVAYRALALEIAARHRIQPTTREHAL